MLQRSVGKLGAVPFRDSLCRLPPAGSWIFHPMHNLEMVVNLIRKEVNSRAIPLLR